MLRINHASYKVAQVNTAAVPTDNHEIHPPTPPILKNVPVEALNEQAAGSVLFKLAETPAIPGRLDLSGSYTGFSLPTDNRPAKVDWRQAFVTYLTTPAKLNAGFRLTPHRGWRPPGRRGRWTDRSRAMTP